LHWPYLNFVQQALRLPHSPFPHSQSQNKQLESQKPFTQVHEVVHSALQSM
jgi:hypothetical protein